VTPGSRRGDSRATVDEDTGGVPNDTVPTERVALSVTVRRAGGTPLIAIAHTAGGSLPSRLNTTEPTEAAAFVANWLDDIAATIRADDAAGGERH
jgi:hypothetical protein